MATRVLLTTTSYQDTPGPHHELLESQGFEIERRRGPLDEATMRDLVGDFDAILCGDDAYTPAVLEKARPRLRVLSKYGIGLDKIDLPTCDKLGIAVLFTPGVNHTTVAEHAFALLLALNKNLLEVANAANEGRWLRPTGHELWHKKIGIVGLGRIGMETAKRARAFEMEIHGFDPYWTAAADELGITRHETLESLFAASEILSLHSNLNEHTRGLVNTARLALMPDGSTVINTSRGELIENQAVLDALDSGKLAAYAADVIDVEPPPADHPLLRHPKTLFTAHIGSRTYESVPRQAMMATKNLINYLAGNPDYHIANKPA